MVQYETVASAPANVSTDWWTPTRIKWIGFVALLWNFAFATLVFTYNGMGLDPTPGAYPGFQAWVLWVPHIVAYLSMIAVLLAVTAWYGFSRLARVIIYGYCGLFAVLAVSAAITLVAPTLDPANVVTDIAWISVHLLALVVGIVLWRTAEVSKLAAALFVSLIPMLSVTIAVAPLVGIEPTVAVMEILLALGAAALGYQLWEHPAPASTATTDGPSASSRSA